MRREPFHWKERGCVSINLGYTLELKVFCHSGLRNETTNFVFQGQGFLCFLWIWVGKDDKIYQPVYFLFAAWISGRLWWRLVWISESNVAEVKGFTSVFLKVIIWFVSPFTQMFVSVFISSSLWQHWYFLIPAPILVLTDCFSSSSSSDLWVQLTLLLLA